MLFEYLNEFAQVYIDNILIYSKIFKEYKAYVRKVLIKLRATGLYIDIEKYEFHVQETTFFNIIISTEGLKIDFRKV